MFQGMKLICGPMATVSHPAFRILLEKFGGCDEYFTEMINAGTLLTGGPFEKYYIDPTPVPKKVVWQITGRTTLHMHDAAQEIIQLPGIGIDINMGCSAPDIYRYGAGIGWMLKPLDETKEMVKSVSDVITEYNIKNCDNKRFSVKLRLGDDNFTDEKFFAFTDMLVDCGVQMLTLHPRTKKEKLARPARYEYCQKLVERYKNEGVKIILNGNVKDKVSFENALSKAPDVDGVMIARASVQKPWIFREISGVSEKITVDMKQLALDYIADIEKYQPQEFWKTRLQRFFTYYCMNFTFSHYAQTMFLNAKNNDDLREQIDLFFNKCPEEQIKTV